MPRVSRRHTWILPAVLAVQAVLLLVSLDLLPLWTDELFTLQTVARPVPEIIAAVQRDIHPPLYYLLLRGWAHLPLPWTDIAALRAFSALWALLATLLLDRFWTRAWRPAHRGLALALFAFSPCLLLYGRMARSYTMQTALVLLAVGLLERWLKNGERHYAVHAQKALGTAVSVTVFREPAAALGAMLALLYTHYVPGIALAAGFAVVAWRKLGWRRVAAFAGALVAGYLPWLVTLAFALGRWGEAAGFASNYRLTGNLLAEQALKIAFGAVSLTIGESFAAASLLLVPVVLLVAARGAFVRFRWGGMVTMILVAAAVGYLGVERWVSYPFIPARLLWLLPFLMLALSVGVLRCRRVARSILVTAFLLSYVSSAWLYYRREGFLNLGYAAPLREIAGRLNREAAADDLILMDAYNTDASVLSHYLCGRTPVLVLVKESEGRVRAAGAAARRVWIARNTRDISPGRITSRLESEVCNGRPRQQYLLEPVADWQRAALGLLGTGQVPSHFYQLVVCGPRGR